MKQYTVMFEPNNECVLVESGSTLLQAEIIAKLHPDAPCGGKGTCGKCRVMVDGQALLACQTVVERDMVVTVSPKTPINLLSK